MISRWSSFNESTYSAIDIDIISDLFINIKEDLHIEFEVKYVVKSEGGNWFDFLEYEDGPVYGVGHQVIIPHYHYSISNIQEFTQHKNLINEIESSCLKLMRMYKLKNDISFEYTDSVINVNIPSKPTKRDACYISYNYLRDYVNEIPLLGEMPSISFKEESGNFLTIITPDDINFHELPSIEEFKEKFNSEFLVYIFGPGKYDSMEKRSNQYIIKNFISTDEIKFKY